MSCIYPTPCIHGDGTNLCSDCQEEFDTDPGAWEEFGEHPQGAANWKAMQEEMAAEAERVARLPPAVPDPNIPF